MDSGGQYQDGTTDVTRTIAIGRPTPEMRERLAKLNPTAVARVAQRLLEATERNYWKPDAQVLEALKRAGEELEDRLEGIYEGSPG